jgi:hypothetical protein
LTLDTYSHVLPSMQKEAAAKLDALLTTVRKNSEGQKDPPTNGA